MIDKKQIAGLYKQNLEKDIIQILAEKKGIDIRTSFNIYYSSKLAEQIENGNCGIENMDPKYLVEDLIENEPGLFVNLDISAIIH
jgi:hypothetical protein